MKKKYLRLGLLGLGTLVEKRLFDVFTKELKNIKIIRVFDKDKKKTFKYSKLFKCEDAKNYREFFIDLDVDFVYIATPSGCHFVDVLNSFKVNKNVIVEKPPVLKVFQLQYLIKFANKKKLIFYTVFQNRYNSAVRTLKKNFKKLNKEKIICTNLNLLWSRNQKYYSGWHGKWKTDGGVLSQQGIHFIDLLCYFLGTPKECASMAYKITNKLQAEDTHIGVIKFNLANCTFNLTTALKPNDYKCEITFFFQTKLIRLHGLCCNNIDIIYYKKTKKRNLEKSFKKSSIDVRNGFGLSHLVIIKEIAKFYFKKKICKDFLARNSLDTLKLVHMLYKSASIKKFSNFNDSSFTSRLGN